MFGKKKKEKKPLTDRVCDTFESAIKSMCPLAREIIEEMENEQVDKFNPIEKTQTKTIVKTDKSLNV